MPIMTMGQALVKFLDNQYVSFDGKDTLTNIYSNNDVQTRYKITKFLPSNLIISPFGNGQYKFIIDPDEENYIERILHDITTMMHSYKGEHFNNKFT